jgi:hypothetical protein
MNGNDAPGGGEKRHPLGGGVRPKNAILFIPAYNTTV